MITVLAFLFVFAVYLTTLYPCIAPEDSGEFVAAAWTLGVPHASGYALYALLGKIAVTVIPFGNPAYRMNILSALLGAGSVVLLADLLRRLLPEPERARDMLGQLESDRWRSTSIWTAAVLWGLVPGTWYLSLLAEVYGLEIFVGLLALWSATRLLETGLAASRRQFLSRWGLTAYLFGLGLSLHHTLVLWGPALLRFFWRRAPAEAKPASVVRKDARPLARWPHWKPALAFAALFGVIGFSLQSYLFARSNAGPLLDTGMADTWSRWLRVVLRQDYGTTSLFKDAAPAPVLDVLGLYGNYLLAAFTPAGLLFVCWGAYRLAQRATVLFQSALLFWLVAGPAFLLFSRPPTENHYAGVIERFYPLSFLGLTVFLAWGVYEAGSRRRWLRLIGAALVPAALVLHAGVSGRGNLQARDFGVNLLKSMPPGSVLWDPGDSAAYSVLYEQAVPGRRSDVASVHYQTTLWGQRLLLDRHRDLIAGRDDGKFRPAFAREVAEGPRRHWLFAEVPRSLPGSKPEDGLAATRYPEDALPIGLAYRYFPAAAYRLLDPAAQLPLAALTFSFYRQSLPWRLARTTDALVPFSFQTKDHFTVEILRRYAEAHTNLGQKFAQYKLREGAERQYDLALAIDPEQMEAYNNLGVLAFESKDFARAALLFRRALRRDPENSSLRSNLALSLESAGRSDEALTAYRSVLELRPGDRDARYRVASLLETVQRPAEALAEWKALRDSNQDDKDVNWRLTRAYAANGQPDKALAALSEYFLLPLTTSERAVAEELRRKLQSSPK